MRIILSTRTQEWGGRGPKNKIIKVSVDTSHMQPAFVGTTKKKYSAACWSGQNVNLNPGKIYL